ncbi:MAG: CNNM domain-containing protein, partial [Agathobacter sp.]|nr:CNNM domain-containing protein [Agathobacter sp.]
MDAGDITQLICLVILLLLSSFFSSAETALTTVNKIRMRTLSESGNKKADRVLRVTDNSAKMLSAILIGNNIVNLSASSLATTLAVKIFGSVGAGIATGILTFLILIFGEVSPKTLATIHADSISLKISGIIEFLMFIFTPFILVINTLSIGFLMLLGVNPNDKDKAITEEELRTIVDVSQETGVIEDEERTMIHKLFDFGDAEAKEVMIPRIDMILVDVNSTYDEVLEIFKEYKYTRLPVFEESIDRIIGVLNIKDLLLLNDNADSEAINEYRENFDIRNIMREAYFTFEHKNTADLFI